MSSRRTMILIGAIAVGVLAAFMLWNHVKGLEDAAYEGAERVEVIVASRDIPAGTDGATAAASFEVRKVPRDVRPATAVVSLDEIQGRVALNTIPANSILVDGMFVDPSVAVSSFSQTLPDGLVAVSFNFAEAQGVGRWLAPGDRVNIMVRTHPATGNDEETDAQASDLEADPQGEGAGAGFGNTESIYAQPARVLYQDVLILSIGQTTIAAPGQETDTATLGSGLLTFAVPQEVALRLASINEADFYLTLVPPSYVPQQIPPLTAEEMNPISLLPGEDPLMLTPYGPDGYEGLVDEIADESDVAFTDEETDETDDGASSGSSTTTTAPAG